MNEESSIELTAEQKQAIALALFSFAVSERLAATSAGAGAPSTNPMETDIMGSPLQINIPHRLGILSARQRIDSSLCQLAAILPGGMARDIRWTGNTMACSVDALGQRVACEIDVQADRVTATIGLPPLLMAFADVIRSQVADAGAAIVQDSAP